MMEYSCKNCGNVYDDALGTCPACGTPAEVSAASGETKTADPQPEVKESQPFQQQPFQQQPFQQPYQQQPYQQQPYQNTTTYNYSNPNATYQAGAPMNGQMYGVEQKSKLVAGLLGIFLGIFGVHNFYLGFTGKAVAQLLITVLSCGTLAFVSALWGFVEGILILAGSINRDATGNLLGE